MHTAKGWKKLAQVIAASAVLSTCLVDRAGAESIAAKRATCGHIGEVDLRQKWTQGQREAFWFSSQGSRIMPYSWFVALEQEGSQQPLIDPCFMESLGFVSVPGYKLPIGFAQDKNPAGTATYVGLTCAACHTSRLNIGGHWAIVEGGQSLVDFSRFPRCPCGIYIGNVGRR